MIIEEENNSGDRDDRCLISLTGRSVAHPVKGGIGAVAGARTDRSAAFGGVGPIDSGSRFNGLGPAYGFGLTARGRYPGRDFDDVEPALSRDWARRGASILSWAWARHAAREAWSRHTPAKLLCA